MIITNEEFKELITRFNEEELKLQSTKGAEYRRSDDVLANFKRLGDALGVHPALVCMIYLQKHMDSIISFVKGGMDESKLAEPIMGRIQDARNYLLLLAGIFEEFRGLGSKYPILPIIDPSTPGWKLMASAMTQATEEHSCGECFFWQIRDEADSTAPCGKTGHKKHRLCPACEYFRKLGEEE